MQQTRLLDPVEVGRQGGIKRAAKLTTQERRESASLAAKARWHPQEYKAAKDFANLMVQFAQQKLRDGSIAPQV